MLMLDVLVANIFGRRMKLMHIAKGRASQIVGYSWRLWSGR